LIVQRQERISDLASREHARRQLPMLLMKIGDALNAPLCESDVLPWEMSKDLKDEIQKRVRLSLQEPRDHLVLPPADRDRFDEEFRKRAQKFGPENVVLSLGGFADSPLVQVQASLVASRFYELWKVGDTVVICSADLSCGVLADWYPDDPVQAFEIAGWSELA
jgi:hypothetical protein